MNSDSNNFNKKVHKGESAEADLTEATPPNLPSLLSPCPTIASLERNILLRRDFYFPHEAMSSDGTP